MDPVKQLPIVGEIWRESTGRQFRVLDVVAIGSGFVAEIQYLGNPRTFIVDHTVNNTWYRLEQVSMSYRSYRSRD